MAKKSRIAAHIQQKANSKYSLKKDIESSPLKSMSRPSASARKYIMENCEAVAKSKILPGMMIMFRYFEPKNKEELEYYDAWTCTIFFGVVDAKEGKRVLGFNIHYYPTKMRVIILNKIFEIYKPIMVKYFSDGISKEIDSFDYQYLIDALEKAKLSFGVRMYIPELIDKPVQVKPNQWNVAAYTEGIFKKRTRESIVKYWNNWKGA